MKKRMRIICCTLSACALSICSALSASAGTLTAEELFEKYSDCYTVTETEYSNPYEDVNSALLEKNPALLAEDSVYYRVDGRQYTALWTFAADEHYGLNEWCGYADDSYVEREYFNCDLIDGIYYGLQEDGTYAVAGADYDFFISNHMTVLEIPEEVNGHTVTRIAKSAFTLAKYSWEALEEVILPDTVQRICADAFYKVFADDASNCKINMPGNVEYLGNGAFSEAMLAFGDTLTLPDSIEYVHWNALQDHDYKQSEYVKLVLPDHLILTTDGKIGTLQGTDESFVYADNLLSIIDAIPYVLANMQTGVAGDVNNDGEVDIVDAVLLSRYLAQDTTVRISDAGFVNADADGNGEITAEDLLVILKRIAKITE